MQEWPYSPEHNMEMAKKKFIHALCTSEVVSDKPGKCPKCGMTLVKKSTEAVSPQTVKLESLLKPTNEFVISTIPLTTVSQQSEPIEIDALGNIGYDTREVGSISARVTGRIEKLYVRYRYQKSKQRAKDTWYLQPWIDDGTTEPVVSITKRCRKPPFYTSS